MEKSSGYQNHCYSFHYLFVFDSLQCTINCLKQARCCGNGAIDELITCNTSVGLRGAKGYQLLIFAKLFSSLFIE